MLLVLVGYLAGYWSAATRKETPIVFQDVPDGGGVLSADDLRALTQAVSLAPEASPSAGAANVPKIPVGDGAYLASTQGAKYYLPSCREVSRIKEENRVWFASAEEAKEAGYEPSVCVQRQANK